MGIKFGLKTVKNPQISKSSDRKTTMGQLLKFSKKKTIKWVTPLRKPPIQKMTKSKPTKQQSMWKIKSMTINFCIVASKQRRVKANNEPSALSGLPCYPIFDIQFNSIWKSRIN
jgi:hypothetical protein